MDPRDRFSQTVEDYRRYRPDYPAALFDWIEQHAELEVGSVVVDIGCGTGISSHLASRGWRTIGVDRSTATPSSVACGRAPTCGIRSTTGRPSMKRSAPSSTRTSETDR